MGLLAVLIVGFAAGFVTHRSMINKRFQKMQRMDRAQFMTDRIIDIVDASEIQADSIRAIVDRDLKNVRKARKEHLKENRKRMEHLFQQIKNQLNEEQVEAFEKEKKRMMKARRKKFRKRKNSNMRE